MAVSGLGQDGYARIQKETTWGTGITSSMTLLPLLPDSTFDFFVEDIENANVISSRLKQLPNSGRTVVKFALKMKLPFTLIGALLNLLLGTSADAGPIDSAYTHTWLTPVSGERISKSFTMQVAFGGDTAVQFVGCMFSSLKISGDNKGQIVIELSGVGKSFSTGVSRISSFTFPSAIPGNFAMYNINIDPADAAAFDQLCNSFEFSLDLNYDLERFKGGSPYTYQPVFKGIPSMMLKANIDADKQYREAAQAKTLYDHVLSITSTEYAAGTTPYKLEIEIPKAKLTPETKIPYGNDRLAMDIEFDCSYGAATTGSSSVPVQGEFRNVDATAAYA
jgi:hypothetical protein